MCIRDRNHSYGDHPGDHPIKIRRSENVNKTGQSAQCMTAHNFFITRLLFTHHYPARCFGMNMPKSRDIQAKIPLPQAIWNFGYVTVNGVNSSEQ